MPSSSSSASAQSAASCCSSRIRITWCRPTASARVSPSTCKNSAARSPMPRRDPPKGRSRMSKLLPHKPVLFFDFDNTLTDGDVLDELIARYSPDEYWRDWEHAWSQGELAARDCLQLQVENMRVSHAELFDYLRGV